MPSVAQPNDSLVEVARELAIGFAERAADHDAEGSFVAENFAALRRHKLFSAGVPRELGGGGARYSDLCQMVKELARGCGSTALALSMHTHAAAMAVWRYRHAEPGEVLLRKVAEGELVLVSTGAGDWVDSSGRAERVPGGYKVSGLKRFCSGAPAGDLLVTSAPSEEPDRAPEVLHFTVALRTAGVTIRDDWDTHGMRGTGSHSVDLRDVFVPEDAVTLRRLRGHWHASWNLAVCVALPLFMAPYVGIAECAAQIVYEAMARRAGDPISLQLLGEMQNALAVVQMAFREMVEIPSEYDIEPSNELSSRMLVRKTLLTRNAIETVSKAVELIGGSAYYRRQTLERLMRDVEGARFHPLPEKKQLDFTARVALGLPPV